MPFCPPRMTTAAACQYARGMAEQMALGQDGDGRRRQARPPRNRSRSSSSKGVKSVVIHEVGHTLGLRHNFKASALWTMDELNDPEKTRDVGLAASVMDYLPVNISPKGKKQGDYFSLVPGPYDYWAIEYAYKPLRRRHRGRSGELAEDRLALTPSRPWTTPPTTTPTARPRSAGEPARPEQGPDRVRPLAGGTDRPDSCRTWSIGRSSRAKGISGPAWRSASCWASTPGRWATSPTYIGGVYVHRDHKGDPDARPPFVIAEAKKQREALAMLEQQVFGPEAYQFPRDLYNYLAPPHWSQWGMREPSRPDFPVHETVLTMQDHVLAQILSPVVLARLLDSELKVPAKQDAFTAAELLRRLTAAIFRETEKLREGKFTDRTPAISSLRRNLQQHYFQRLADLALGNADAPADCQTVAAAELQSLEGRIDRVLAGKAQLDTYTRAHLSELAARIRKVLDARLELKRP